MVIIAQFFAACGFSIVVEFYLKRQCDVVASVDGVSNNTYRYNGNTYRKRSGNEAELGFILASAASALIYKALPSFSNPFLKQLEREHENNHFYKQAFFDSFEKSGLKEHGLKINHVELSPFEIGLSPKNISNYDVKAGLNAFFTSEGKKVVLNTDKAAIAGFHELGHALNCYKSKFWHVIQKLRVPGYYLAGLMGTVAVLSRPKPKDAPDKTPLEWVQDHATSLAVLGMVPTVAEEAKASYNGIKLAKTVGLSEPLVKNLKKI